MGAKSFAEQLQAWWKYEHWWGREEENSYGVYWNLWWFNLGNVFIKIFSEISVFLAKILKLAESEIRKSSLHYFHYFKWNSALSINFWFHYCLNHESTAYSRNDYLKESKKIVIRKYIFAPCDVELDILNLFLKLFRSTRSRPNIVSKHLPFSEEYSNRTLQHRFY